MKKSTSGFTIVELLIVIVIIAILAAITVVAFNGIQGRARDAQRANDIAQIKKALLAYDAIHGGVVRPQVTGYTNPGWNGWDTSTGAQWLIFLRNNHGAMPVDPVNVNPSSGTNPHGGSDSRAYIYYCYNAGHTSGYPDTAGVILSYRKDDGTIVHTKFPVTSCLLTIPT